MCAGRRNSQPRPYIGNLIYLLFKRIDRLCNISLVSYKQVDDALFESAKNPIYRLAELNRLAVIWLYK